MFKDINEARSIFERFHIENTSLDNHLQLYQEILGCLPEGALKRLFIIYSAYEPYKSMANDWWNFYNSFLSKSKRKPLFAEGNAVLFMWATRATRRMEK